MRKVVWFSCGAASACAAKLAIDAYGHDDVRVVYCDTLAYEHPDNQRFFEDVSEWIEHDIVIIHSREYRDIWDVFERTRFLNSAHGARCTTEMKKIPRMEYQRVDDLQMFGLTAGEERRAERLRQQNPDILHLEFPLIAAGWTKGACYLALRQAKIELPAMYKLGYKNNNCIGCVKGGQGYWNKIRVDFPETFERMAKMERELNWSLTGVFLDELSPNAGNYHQEEEDECSILCHTPGFFF